MHEFPCEAAASALAAALDSCGWTAATALIDAACMYDIDGEQLTGPEPIIASYKGGP